MTALPLLLCLCGPGASGKSTLCRKLVESRSDCVHSVSTTTRAPRPGEKEGTDYYFTSREDFVSKIESGFFAEHAQFGDNLYGTGKDNVDRSTAASKHLLLDIESHGVASLRKLYGDRVVCVFVFPPSFAILSERLTSRATDSQAQIEFRLAKAREEIELLSTPGMSNYFVVNDNLDVSLSRLDTILSAESLRFSLQVPAALAAIFGN